MKIGINTLFYIPGEVGGSETYLLEILKVWKEEGIPHEVVLFTNQENHERLAEFEGQGWSRVLCPFQASNRVVRILREQFELPFKVKKSGVDVLWSPGYTMPFWVPCKQVVSILDMQYKRFPQDLSFVGRWTTEVLVQMGTRRADQLLTISEFSKQEIIELTPAKAENITVTPLAADKAFSVPVSGEVDVPKPYILCVANSYPHKNVDQLIRAYAAVQDEIPHTLVWIGRPRLGEPAIEEAMAKVQNPERLVRLTGVSRSELIQLYQQAELFVFPSLYEGFGLPVLESLLAGTPVLTTTCGSLPEVGGEYVSTFDPTSDNSLASQIKNLFNGSAVSTTIPVDDLLNGFTWKRTSSLTLMTLQSTHES